MKQLLILSAVLFALLVSCKKDTVPLPEYWKGSLTYGWSKCTRNGVLWETSAAFAYTNPEDSSVCLSTGTFTTDTIVTEDLGIVRIPLQVGTYQVFQLGLSPTDPLGTIGIFHIGYDDQADAVWDIDKKKYSSVTIDSYDPATKTLTGKFDLHFTKNRGWNYPDKISFENGTFEAKIFR